jgi:glycogen debranching enzyme
MPFLLWMQRTRCVAQWRYNNAPGTLHVFPFKDSLGEHVTSDFRIHNYGRAAVEFSFSVEFDADFADIFEVRGIRRNAAASGYRRSSHDGLVLAYDGLDDCVAGRESSSTRHRTRLTESAATYQIQLEPGEESHAGRLRDADVDSQWEVKPCYEKGCPKGGQCAGIGGRTRATDFCLKRAVQ